MQLLKLEYTPLKDGLWQTDVLNRSLILITKYPKKGSELLLSFS